MAVCRVEKSRNYTTMSNYHLRDPCLSNKARGLLSTMLSLPEKWDYTTRGLAAICKDGVDGITAQLKELEQCGYLVRHRIRDANGRITDMEYIIYERPHPSSPDTEKPDMVKPDMALPCLETPAQRNIDISSIDELNTDVSITHSIPSGEARPSVLASLEAKRKEAEYRDMDMYREIIKENIDYLQQHELFTLEDLDIALQGVSDKATSIRGDMFIYQNFPVKLTLSKDMDKELKELQKQFMPEDTKAGLIQSFLDNYKGTQVCSKLIYAEALNHPFDEPKQWEIREINEIMNNCIEGWRAFSNPRSFAKYGRQRGWERIPPPDNEPSATGSNLTDGFHELTEEEARQMELPF